MSSQPLPNQAPAVRDKVRFSKKQKNIATLTLASPPVNSIDTEMADLLLHLFKEIESDLSVRALIIHGVGEHFCAGADLKEKAAKGPGDGDVFWRMIETLEALRCPTIAAVHGGCAGGGLEVALSCDIRLAADDAKFICAGVNVGLTASAAKLTKLVGLAQAKSVLLTGLPFNAATAYRMGLVAAATSRDALMNEALRLAERIASRAPLAVEATKRIANAAPGLSMAEVAQMQRSETAALRQSEDHKTGVAAMLKREMPDFKRR